MPKTKPERFLHLVVYQNGKLIKHSFMSETEDGRFASVGGMSENLSDYLTNKFPENLAYGSKFEGFDPISGIFIYGFPKDCIREISKLCGSELYGCEKSKRDLDELYRQREELASPFGAGGGGFEDLEHFLQEE